ncbi:6-phosphogluconolactonase [soil metagenome]
MQIKVYETPQETAECFAEYIYLKSQYKTAKGEFFNLGLSGGSTPELLFKILAAKNLQWEKVKLFWVDERCVPPDNDESNYKKVNELLLKSIEIPEVNIFRMKGEEDPEMAADEYSQELLKNLPLVNDTPSLDLLFLGVGEDGHTASIFPGNLGILDSEKLCLHTVNPSTKQDRLTLTAKVINNSSEISFLITGEKKAKVFNEILNRNPEAIKYPAYHISTMENNLIYWLDKSVVV